MLIVPINIGYTRLVMLGLKFFGTTKIETEKTLYNINLKINCSMKNVFIILTLIEIVRES